ncbi:MAG: SDR family oxidoreductase [Euryarchaeota archaeon]|nr:SDR family oxidoreductase [Euryarchaeota archaeon]|tara:strand:- start:2465 stop:3214 length:750 start_codon:yes stop_codon:yes gene_type:complete
MSVKINLSGKTTLITGATRGIGKAIQKTFGIANSSLILTGTDSSKISELNKTEKRPNVKWVTADFSSSEGIELFINKIKAEDKIDICINNAGINIIKNHHEYSLEEIQRLTNINLLAPCALSQHIAKKMGENNFGRIVNIASIWSEISKSRRSIYSMSKSGLVGLTRSLAIEYGSKNVLINAVSPGFTKTELTDKSLSSDQKKKLIRQIPLRRFAKPSEVAKTTLFLCSDLNSYITGQNIVADGGFTIV